MQQCSLITLCIKLHCFVALLVETGESRTPRPKDALQRYATSLSGYSAFSSPKFITGKSFVRLANNLSIRCIGEHQIGTPLVGALIRSAGRVLTGRAATRRLRRILYRQLIFLPPVYRGKWHLGLQSQQGGPLSKPRVPFIIVKILPQSGSYGRLPLA